MFSYRKKKQEPLVRNNTTTLSQSKIEEILRTVSRNDAFYFYNEIGKPTGHVATSLLDFQNKINIVQSSSLVFHLRRKDFENWIREIIRDSELAKRISNISPTDFYVKTKLYATINTRIKELRETPSTPTVISEEFLAAPRFSDTEIPR